jgi:hypothetical protein
MDSGQVAQLKDRPAFFSLPWSAVASSRRAVIFSVMDFFLRLRVLYAP